MKEQNGEEGVEGLEEWKWRVSEARVCVWLAVNPWVSMLACCGRGCLACCAGAVALACCAGAVALACCSGAQANRFAIRLFFQL